MHVDSGNSRDACLWTDTINDAFTENVSLMLPVPLSPRVFIAFGQYKLPATQPTSVLAAYCTFEIQQIRL